MDTYFKFAVKGLLLAAVFLLSGCALQGPYFPPQAAAKSVHYKNKVIHPILIPVNANLYASTFDQQPKDKTQAPLWYTNDYGYKVGPTDVLTITVWNHPELSTPLRLDTAPLQDSGLSQTTSNIIPGILVSAKGNIYFPYAGNLHVAGLTVNQLRVRLSEKLRHFIRDPQVNVRLAAFRSQTVQVLGAVSQQGSVPLTDHPLTVLDAIAERGGIDNTAADTHHIYVIRGHGLKPYIFMFDADSPSNLLIAQHFKLYNQDIIYVPQSSLANWNRFVSQVLPTVEAVAYTRSLTK
jgi:polysaccharide export outer membrane protein